MKLWWSRGDIVAAARDGRRTHVLVCADDDRPTIVRFVNLITKRDSGTPSIAIEDLPHDRIVRMLRERFPDVYMIRWIDGELPNTAPPWKIQYFTEAREAKI